MKSKAAVSVFILMTVSTCLYAQDSLVGKYSGSFTFRSMKGGDTPIGLDLVIASVENGKVTGTAVSHSTNCRGEYPMAGKYDGSKLFIRSTAKGGQTGDCSLRLRLTIEGNKLVGETGSGLPVELSKR